MTYETRTTKMIVGVKGEPIFDDRVTKIEIVDEAGGEFLEVSQEDGKLCFNEKEWPHVRDAVDNMFKLCRNYD